MKVKKCKTTICTIILFTVLFIGAAFMVKGVGETALPGESEKPRETQKRKRQDRIGQVPQTILAQQSLEKVKAPPMGKAVKTAWMQSHHRSPRNASIRTSRGEASPAWETVISCKLRQDVWPSVTHGRQPFLLDAQSYENVTLTSKMAGVLGFLE